MNATVFSEKVAEWYKEHHRLLPWRQTRNPYKIWLSEIILQQTRVAQGLPYYRAFLRRYPTVKSLAAASEQEVLRMWQGLGYYSRARNLHACAKTIAKNYHGKFPRTFAELKRLRGVGDYTAAAVASFAFHERVAVVDGNVFRVLSRVFGISDDIASTTGKKRFTALANSIIPACDPATHNQAIMEFGAMWCTPRNPQCDRCPLSRGCVARQRGLQAELPVKQRADKPRHRHFIYLVVRHGRSLLLKRRDDKDIWRGLWDFPLLESTRKLSDGELAKELGNMVTKSTPLIFSREYKHVLSHQIIFARFAEVNMRAGTKWPRGGFFSSAVPCGPQKIHRLPKPVLVTRYLEEKALE
jgi:A/G-specific adenine glycosylase